jgi:uncharacterized glyoxalase superfamily protein PhnB
MPFSEAPVDLPKEGEQAGNRIMHASLTKGAGLLMVSDTMTGWPLQKGNNDSACIECESLQET